MFPGVNGSNSSTEPVSTTTHDVSLPAGIQAGELLMVFAVVSGATSYTAWTSGWYIFRNVPTSSRSLVSWFRYADGTETAFQFTTSASVTSAHISWRLGCFQPHAAPQAATASAISTNPNPPNLAPVGWGADDILWVPVVASVGTTAYPAGYGDNQLQSAAGAVAVSICSRELNAASEDPGTYTAAVGQWAALTFALRPVQAVGIPGYVNRGNSGSHTFNHSDYTLPEGMQPDDFMVMTVETEAAPGWPAPTGFTLFPDSPQTVDIPVGSGTQLNMCWRRYQLGDTPPTVTAFNHASVCVAAFRGVENTGTPYDVTAGGTDTTDDTSAAIPGDTTTQDGCLIVAACSTDNDYNSTTEFSAWANADLANVGEVLDYVHDAGHGGGAGAAIGELAAAGAYGNTTATLANNSYKGMISVALLPDTLGSVPCEPQTRVQLPFMHVGP